ncbi:MAG: hypothetical protein ABIF71_02690 [Planctomycetota bacterium]
MCFATNLLDGLDQASLRRFDWKVLFKPLLPDSAVRLFKRYFKASLSPADEHALRRIPGLTPGLFKAVWHKNRFLPTQPAPAFLEDLQKEATYQDDGKTIGIGFLGILPLPPFGRHNQCLCAERSCYRSGQL